MAPDQALDLDLPGGRSGLADSKPSDLIDGDEIRPGVDTSSTGSVGQRHGGRVSTHPVLTRSESGKIVRFRIYPTRDEALEAAGLSE